MAVVILEGIDRVGKTTTREKLESIGFHFLKDESVHALSSNDDHASYAHGGINGILMVLENLSDGQDVVVDRFHITEWVYGIAERGYAPLYTWEVDERLAELGAKLILLLPESIDAVNARSFVKRIENGREPVDLSLHQSLMEVAYSRSVMGKLPTDINCPTERLEDFIRG